MKRKSAQSPPIPGKGVPSSPPPIPPSLSLFNPAELERYTDFLIFARSMVEGTLAGRHPSRRHGASVEFFDYKTYAPGDDPRRVDWRVYARTRKLYLRKFREETEMTAHLLVDASGSMKYMPHQGRPKSELTARIAAALAYLTIRQGDKASLTVFANRVLDHVPPGGTRHHMHRILGRLEKIKPMAGTGLASSLQECSSLFRRPGQLVVISDFLDDIPAVLDALCLFVHRGFEVLLLQVLDPDEMRLPNVEIARFVDMETGEELSVEPAAIRQDYEKTMQDLVRGLEEQSSRRRIRYQCISNRQPYGEAIEAYLGFRNGTGGG